ncbi:MAG TPA: alpha/beta hydrolase, partial [Longimicrobiaceae bacterium]|nr:alpha/beta hydrolase [Longimicrobiaceae bacterium]
MSAPLLAHTQVAAPGSEPRRWLLVLHGIFGAGRNWGTIARRLVEARPEWGAVLVDLRMHGRSRGFSPPHGVAAAADDVQALADHLGLHAAAVLGHSFGGKVALLYAERHGGELRQGWVIDSTPSAQPEPSGVAWQMIEVVRGLPAHFSSRAEAVEGMVRAGYERGVAEWMAINLEPAEGRYRWRLDLAAMEEMLRDFFRTDLWRVVESPPPGVELHFVKATRSATMDAAAVARVRAAAASGRVFLHLVEGGHWLN